MKRTLAILLFVLICSGVYGSLPAPSAIAASSQGTDITLVWLDPLTYTASPAIVSYNIFRSTFQGGFLVPLSNVADNAGSSLNVFVDPAVNTANPIFYAVQSVDAMSNTGPMSSVINVYSYGPAALTVSAYNSKVLLTWAAGYDTEITNYNIYRSTMPNLTDLAVVGQGSGGTYLDTGVFNGYLYYYAMAGIKAGNTGALSATFTAAPFAPPYAPQGITAVSAGGNQVYLDWENQPLQGTYPVGGYSIFSATSPGFETASFTPVSAQYATISSASAGTIYFKMDTVDSRGNSSQPFYFSFFIPGSPNQPSGLIVTSYSATSVSLQWNANNQAESVTSYTVIRSPGGALPSVTAPSYQDTGLAPGAVYSYYVEAQSNSGTSTGSPAVTITASPAPPLNALAQNGNPGDIVINWAPSASAAADGVTGYNIYKALTESAFNFSSADFPNVASPVTDSAMDCTKTYKYAITALSPAVEGQPAFIPYAKAVTLPADVTGLAGASFDSYAKLAWDMPGPVYNTSFFNVYRSVSNTPEAYTVVTSTAKAGFYDYSLANGTVYYYKVTANNLYGESNTINAVSVISVTPSAETAPDAPQNVTCVSGGDNKIYLSWTPAPAGTGITAYNVYRRYDTSSPYDTVPSAVTTTTVFIDTLTSTYTAYYTVRSFAGITLSAQSSEVSGMCFLKPSPVANLRAENINGSVLLSWDQPASVATLQTITQYNIYRSTASAGGYLNLSKTALTMYSDSVANTSTTTYYYKVRTVDDSGNEDVSTSFAAITVEQALLPPPVVVAKAGDRRVTLAWLKVTPDSYNIYRRKETEAYGPPLKFNVDFASSEYVDTAVLTQTAYYYTVAAVNASGEGPKSLEAMAVPYAAPTIPDKSLNYTIVNKRDVNLTWKPAVKGDYDIASYIVRKSSDGGGTFQDNVFTVPSDITAQLYSVTDTVTNWDNDYIYMVVVKDSQGYIDVAYNLANVVLPKAVNKLRVFRNLFNPGSGEKLPIHYFVIQNGPVRVRIYTLSGDFVTELANDRVTTVTGSGATIEPYESPDLFWDGKNIKGQAAASGVYIISLEMEGVKVTAKVALVK
jgi:titin